MGNMTGKRLLLTLVLLMGYPSLSLSAEPFSEQVDAEGKISFPKDFRNSMVHLGSWFVPAGDASGFHDVYTEAESMIYYQKNGRFPDGAVLVKELRAAQSGDFTTGKNVHHATDTLKQWFVMIKDSQNRFANNPIWGEGWGWALFKPGNIDQNLARDYKVDCLGCHIPARSTDWIYTQAYPVLHP
jgi:hypothetical protein